MNVGATDAGAELAEDPNSTTALWAAINVGDQIQLEADLIEQGVRRLSKSKFYTVLAKVDSQGGAYFDAFVVESDLVNELVHVSPAFVCNYNKADHVPTLT